MLGLEEIIGLEVISSDARVLGTVEGVMIDTAAWKVRSLRVGLRRGLEEMLGHKRRYFSVDKAYLRTIDVQSVSDAVILSKPISSLPELFRAEEKEASPAGALLGKRVICCNARFLGNVDNLLTDPSREWAIPYLQVKLERDALDLLNLHRPLLSSSLLSLRTADVRSIGDMIIMAMTMDDLRAQLSQPRPAQPTSGGMEASEKPSEEERPLLVQRPFP